MAILTHILPISLLVALTIASPLGDLTTFDPSLPVSIPFPGFKLDQNELLPELVSSSSSLEDNEALNKALALYSASASGSGVDTVAKRDTPYIFVCTDVDFSGKCQKLYHNRDECYDLHNGFYDTISSINVPSGQTCILFNDEHCNARQGKLTVQGTFTTTWLGDYGFNDIISSYFCY